MNTPETNTPKTQPPEEIYPDEYISPENEFRASHHDEDEDHSENLSSENDPHQKHYPNSIDSEEDPVVEGKDGWLIKQSTAELYQSRVNRLWRETAESKKRMHMTTEETAATISPVDVVRRLIERSQNPGAPDNLSMSSWQAYRSALLYDFEKNKDRSEDYVTALNLLKEHRIPEELLRAQNKIERKRRISKNKISKEHLKALLDELGSTQKRNASWGSKVQIWLMAGLATGIRPGEWEGTKWADESKTLLMAPNSKVKADTPATIRDRISAEANSRRQAIRTQPQYRAIPVDDVDKIYVDKHMAFIEDAAANGMPFDTYYTIARKRLWMACKSLWGEKFTYGLYVARHQFSADLKATATAPDEIARLMGHANTRAARRHYAKAKASHLRTPHSEKLQQTESAAETSAPESTQQETHSSVRPAPN